VSLAPLINAASLSKPRSCRKLLPLLNGVAAAGPFQLRLRTLDRLPVPIASCRVLTPVSNKLVPAIEIFIGSTVGPFNNPVLSETRPPQPVCPEVLQIEVICWAT